MSFTPDPARMTPEFLAEYNGDPITVTAILFIILNTLFFFLRVLSRHYQKAPFGWDDAFMIPAWATTVALCACTLISIRYGAGRHIEWVILDPDRANKRGMIDLLIEPIVWTAAITFPKLSILVFYLRIFTDKFSRWTSYVLMGVTGLLCVINIFIYAFECQPHSKAWNPLGPGKCIDIWSHFIYSSLFNWVTDFIMLVLPLPTIWRLRTTTKIKLGLLATFLIGSIGMIASIVRWTIFLTNEFIFGDQSWYNNPLTIWLFIEPSMYLISACLISLRTLIVRVNDSRAMSRVYNLLSRSRGGISSTGQSTSQYKSNGYHRHEGSESGHHLPTSASDKIRDDPHVVTIDGYGDSLEMTSPGKIHVRKEYGVNAV